MGKEQDEPSPPEGKGEPEGKGKPEAEVPEADRKEEEAFRAKVRHYARRARLFRG